jgi:hypothetical protein
MTGDPHSPFRLGRSRRSLHDGRPLAMASCRDRQGARQTLLSLKHPVHLTRTEAQPGTTPLWSLTPLFFTRIERDTPAHGAIAAPAGRVGRKPMGRSGRTRVGTTMLAPDSSPAIESADGPLSPARLPPDAVLLGRGDRYNEIRIEPLRVSRRSTNTEIE